MKKISLVIFSLCGFLQPIKAQESAPDVLKANIRWNSEKFLNPATHTYSQMNCSFITEGERKIIWDQNNGKVVYEMTIDRVEGTWEDVSKPGTINYFVDMNGTKGQLSITRDDAVVKLKMDFKRGEGRDMNYEFVISDFKLQ